MSAFTNGSGTGTTDQSGLGSSLQAGNGNILTVGNGTPDSPRFQLPPDIANAIAGGTGTQPMAGLTGVQSGMTMPNFSNAMGGSGDYSFTMPDSNGPNLGALAAGGAKMSQDLMNQKGPQSGGTGRVTTTAKNFNAPVIALPMASGSNAGNSLLQMMQRYQPANMVGTNTGTGYGIR